MGQPALADREIRVNHCDYRVAVYPCDETGGYRAEAGYQGRVIEVVDTPGAAAAWAGIRKRLAARHNPEPKRTP